MNERARHAPAQRTGGTTPASVAGRLVVPVAWTVAAASVPLTVASLLLRVHVDDMGPWFVLGGDSPLPFVAFAAVGALIVTHRRGNLIGWLLLLSATSLLSSDVAGLYATNVREGSVAVWAAWFSTWAWSPGFFALFIALPLTFPTGRLPSPRWRWVWRVTSALVLIQVLAVMVTPGPMEADERMLMDNPVGISGIEGLLTVGEAAAAVASVPLMLIGVPLALATRFRRSRGVERAQVKWFLLAAAVTLTALIATTHPVGDRIIQAGGAPAFLAMPTAIGIAILRHRLYDIDRVVSRTVSYAILTGLLIALYVGGVFALRGLVVGEGGSQLAVAASTLLVAAAFQPLRRRVQGLVDRRFNRARYDAAETVESFRRTVRDEVDLGHLSDELRRAVAETVSPAGASVWLRGVGRSA